MQISLRVIVLFGMLLYPQEDGHVSHEGQRVPARLPSSAAALYPCPSFQALLPTQTLVFGINLFPSPVLSLFHGGQSFPASPLGEGLPDCQ